MEKSFKEKLQEIEKMDKVIEQCEVRLSELKSVVNYELGGKK